MRPIFLGLLILALIAGGVATVMGRSRAQERVYTVAEVQANLRQHPRAWIGRTLWVRGELVVSYWGTASIDPLRPPPDVPVHLMLIPAPASTQTGPPGGNDGPQISLQVAPHFPPHRANALVDLLRRIPFVRRAFAPTTVWRVFRLTLLARYGLDCPAQGCADAQLDEEPLQ